MFPWFGLLGAYASPSVRVDAAVDLLFLLEEGPVKTLKDGRLTLAERRRLGESSGFFREAWETVLPSGG